MPPLQPGLDGVAESQLARTIELRRTLHAHPELGNDLPETKARVLDALAPLGLEITHSKTTSSIVATLSTGRPGPCLLLRADMDALPLTEDSGVAFTSRNAGAMHARASTSPGWSRGSPCTPGSRAALPQLRAARSTAAAAPAREIGPASCQPAADELHIGLTPCPIHTPTGLRRLKRNRQTSIRRVNPAS